MLWVIIITIVLLYILGKNPENVILAVVCLGLICVDFFIFAPFLWIFVLISAGNAVSYIGGITSKMEAIVLVALITGAVAILNSICTAYLKFRDQRREYLSAKREGPYSDFIDIMHELSTTNPKYKEGNVVNDIKKINAKLMLWGSVDVVKKWNEFSKTLLESSDHPDSEETWRLIEEVINQMRKDLGVKAVKKGNLFSSLFKYFEK